MYTYIRQINYENISMLGTAAVSFEFMQRTSENNPFPAMVKGEFMRPESVHCVSVKMEEK